jgi:hypothetical protein
MARWAREKSWRSGDSLATKNSRMAIWTGGIIPRTRVSGGTVVRRRSVRDPLEISVLTYAHVRISNTRQLGLSTPRNLTTSQLRKRPCVCKTQRSGTAGSDVCPCGREHIGLLEAISTSRQRQEWKGGRAEVMNVLKFCWC